MNKIKLLIFDFDGTIVDSRQIYYHAIETRLSKSGFSKKQIDKAIDMGLNVSETLKELGFSWFMRFLEKREIMKEVLKNINEVKKCKDVDAIKKIKIRKILVSNSLDEFIYPVLKHLKLRREFNEIFGADDFDNKTEFLEDYLKSNWLKPDEAIYIGDRASDVNLARKIGCVSAIVSGKCSWNSKKEIIKAKPDFIISDIKEIKEII